MEERTRRSLEASERLYADYARGDVAAVMAALHPEIAWTSVGGPDIPWAGTWRGREGVGQFFARLGAAAGITRYAVERRIAQGEWVVVLATVTASLNGGAPRDYAKADVLRFDEAGRVVEFREFFDSGAVAAAFAPGGSAG